MKIFLFLGIYSCKQYFSSFEKIGWMYYRAFTKHVQGPGFESQHIKKERKERRGKKRRKREENHPYRFCGNDLNNMNIQLAQSSLTLELMRLESSS